MEGVATNGTEQRIIHGRFIPRRPSTRGENTINSSRSPQSATQFVRGAAERKPKLLDQVRDAIRTRHYSLRTEESYVRWIKRFILFHGKQHPLEMSGQEVSQFLSALAVHQQVSASTQHQALNAIVFLYREV